MSEVDLTQAEADQLIALPKVKINHDRNSYPGMGGALTVPLTSKDRREYFLLDISRGRIDLLKGKYQERGRQVVVLVRLDFGGPPHRNPDGEEIECPHLHIYREGYGTKYAVPVPVDKFSNLCDLWQTLSDFIRYCNIVDPPDIDRGLFT